MDSSLRRWLRMTIPLTFDVLVLWQETVVPLTIIHSRTIGSMTMIDAGKKDHKIIA